MSRIRRAGALQEGVAVLHGVQGDWRAEGCAGADRNRDRGALGQGAAALLQPDGDQLDLRVGLREVLEAGLEGPRQRPGEAAALGEEDQRGAFGKGGAAAGGPVDQDGAQDPDPEGAAQAALVPVVGGGDRAGARAQIRARGIGRPGARRCEGEGFVAGRMPAPTHKPHRRPAPPRQRAGAALGGAALPWILWMAAPGRRSGCGRGARWPTGKGVWRGIWRSGRRRARRGGDPGGARRRSPAGRWRVTAGRRRRRPARWGAGASARRRSRWRG